MNSNKRYFGDQTAVGTKVCPHRIRNRSVNIVLSSFQTEEELETEDGRAKTYFPAV